MTGALGTNNVVVVRIDGNGNLLDTNNGVENSSGDGVVISGGATGNTVKKYTLKGSSGNGFKVEAGGLPDHPLRKQGLLEWPEWLPHPRVRHPDVAEHPR